MAEQQVVSPVLVERGENHKATCPRCNAPVTVAELKQIFPKASDETLKVVAEIYTKYMEDLKMNTCWNKAHFFAQARVEVGSSFEIKNPESFNYYWESLISTFSAFRTEEGRRKAQEWGRSVKKRSDPGYVPVSEENQKKIAEYAYGPGTKKGKELGNTEEGDGWRFRGRGLIQLTGRVNYTTINSYCKRYKELGDIVLHSDLVTEISMAVFSSMAYWHKNAIYDDANGKKDTEAACEDVGNDVKVKDEEGKNSTNHTEKQKMFNKYSSVAFRIDECLWGEVKDGLQFIEGRAPWMDIAIQEIMKYGGKKEDKIDSRIGQYHREGGGCSGDSSLAWCSSFICWCLEHSNPTYKSPHSPRSRSFLESSSVEKCEVFFGAIAVFSDCDSTGTNISSSGHVTFVYGKLLDREDTYIGLGGNQGDMITLSPNYRFHGKAFPVNRNKTKFKIFRGFYKPKGYVIKEEDKLMESDNYSTADIANKKIGLGSVKTTTGEKDD